ncbi:GNAT family N-acetyltransferase [Microlunatus parietis]|uniref:GNAT superfamily N-acetyltransferase n=1 Tax=Microlunatus parietis TaxID=682979 RepID=A0A7Y9I7Q3_9ACTN|nr:GNAT family N-acetyltransferase [Microlunatus parietis]NYE71861.1 GNAT superfamily N-acetyltransferase [Microlunatus parietis]
MATSQTGPYTTRELSVRTLPDFERFFWQVNGCACALYLFGRHLSPAETLGDQGRRFTGKDWRAGELAAVAKLVREGIAHGILVYADGEPVGWCHFGRADEVPVPRDDSIPQRMFARDPSSDWRITCLLTRIDHRRRGVAGTALAAAVAAIKKRGGGWIEATPAAFPHRDPMLTKLRRAHGWRSPEIAAYLRDHWPTKDIPGIGRVNGCAVTTKTMDHTGMLSMYEKLGFKPTALDEFTGDQRRPWIHVVVRLKV